MFLIRIPFYLLLCLNLNSIYNTAVINQCRVRSFCGSQKKMGIPAASCIWRLNLIQPFIKFNWILHLVTHFV